MSDLTRLTGAKSSTPSERRKRLVEAAQYGQAVAVLEEAGHLEADDLTALRTDADDEIAAAVKSCITANKTPAEVRGAA